jgi:hypothetical protein
MKHKISPEWALIIIIISATGRFDLTIIARIPLAEIIAFGCIPFLLGGRNFQPYMHRIQIVVILLGLWFLGVCLSDLVTGNYFERYIRGAMKPVFCFFWFLFYVGILLKDFRLLLLTPIGSILSALQNYLRPTSFTEDYVAAGGYESMVFGVEPIISACIGALVLWLYTKNRLYSVALMGLQFVILVLMGASRSSILVTFMSAGCLFYVWWTRSKHRKSFNLTISRVILLVLLAGFGLTCIYYAYVFAATEGWLGEIPQQKFASQSKTIFGSSPLGLVLAGRPQVYGAILGIIDTPIVGSGSWTAWLMGDYLYDAMSQVGSDPQILSAIANGAAAGVGHSIIFGTWLENGILSLFAMLGVLWITTKCFLVTLGKDSPIAPIIIIGYIGFLWAYFFSPFDVFHRRTIGFFFALYVINFPINLYFPHSLQRGRR